MNCQVHVEPTKAGWTKALQEENWWEGGSGDYAGFKGMGMSELGQKSKPGERGEAYFLFSNPNPYDEKLSPKRYR